MVEGLWETLRREFGVSGVYVTPYPHFTHQVARAYDEAAVEAALRRFATRHGSLTVRTAGLGIFTGPTPVLYIPVVRDPALAQFHQALWDEIGGAAAGAESYYHPERWLPHITLALDDVDADALAEIVRSLAGRDLTWEIAVGNVSLLTGTDAGYELRLHCPLTG